MQVESRHIKLAWMFCRDAAYLMQRYEEKSGKSGNSPRGDENFSSTRYKYNIIKQLAKSF